MLRIKNSPLILLAAPRFVPSMIILQPGKGSFVSASLTVPDIFPVVPASVERVKPMRMNRNSNENQIIIHNNLPNLFLSK